MPESTNPSQPNIKQLFKPIAIFVFLILVGFAPWEEILSIQIRNNVLAALASVSMGLLGLLGLSITLIIYVKRNNISFSFLAITLLGFITVISGLMLISTFLLPSFEWKDKDVYRNGSDYLVVQEQETFVTSNETYPRIILTPSPYSMIRRVEEQLNLKSSDDRFGGNQVAYKGKIWLKEPARKEE
jgi:hypothetical protein